MMKGRATMVQGKIGNKKKQQEEKFGRNQKENCPVCGKIGTHSELSRHIMNSRGELQHQLFIADQDNLIIEKFDASGDSCSINELSFSEGIFCSTSYVRKLLNRLRPYWKVKAIEYHSIDTSKQYDDGRRRRPDKFSDGTWKASKDLGTGCYMPRQKRNAVIDAFFYDMCINDVAKKIGCKNETVTKIWKEEFSVDKYDDRLNRTYRFLKPTKEAVIQIEKLFNSDKSAYEVADLFDTNSLHVAKIWKQKYTSESYAERVKRMKKEGILKSLRKMGEMSASGHGSRPEYECYMALITALPNEKIIHHDMDIAPPYEIDIAIYNRRLIISWDGPSHRKPIFGDKAFRKACRRDAAKLEILNKANWNVVVVDDDCKKFRYLDMKKIVSTILETSSGFHRIAIDERGQLR